VLLSKAIVLYALNTQRTGMKLRRRFEEDLSDSFEESESKSLEQKDLDDDSSDEYVESEGKGSADMHWEQKNETIKTIAAKRKFLEDFPPEHHLVARRVQLSDKPRFEFED